MTQIQDSNIKVNEVIQIVLQAAKNVLGSKLDTLILYGSYARGDYEVDKEGIVLYAG